MAEKPYSFTVEVKDRNSARWSTQHFPHEYMGPMTITTTPMHPGGNPGMPRHEYWNCYFASVLRDNMLTMVGLPWAMRELKGNEWCPMRNVLGKYPKRKSTPYIAYHARARDGFFIADTQSWCYIRGPLTDKARKFKEGN